MPGSSSTKAAAICTAPGTAITCSKSRATQARMPVSLPAKLLRPQFGVDLEMVDPELFHGVAVGQPCQQVWKPDAFFGPEVRHPQLHLRLALVIDHGRGQMGLGVEVEVDHKIVGA